MTKAPQELVSFLLDPKNYPHHMGKVTLVQTHLSWVFVGHRWVYKVKKPVTFSFLDFGTLDKRRYFLHQEHELNQRLASFFYEGPVALYRDDQGRLNWQGRGEVAEWALKMKRFPVGSELSERLRRGQVSRGDMARLSRFLSGFYGRQRAQNQPPLRYNPRLLITNNLNQAAEVLTTQAQKENLAFVRAAQQRHFATFAPWHKRRMAAGWVVEGHGDLQTGHVLFLPPSFKKTGQGKTAMPSFAVFDCIEFNRDFRVADVAYDVSFLVMDLAAAGRPDLALAFLKDFEKRLGGEDMTAVQASFTAHRATIRAKVLGLKARDTGVPTKEQQAALAQCAHYLQTAVRLAHLGLKPRWVVVMGNIASGKSTLSQALAGRLGVAAHNSDVARKAFFGLKPHDNGAAIAHRLYSPAITRRTYRELARLATLSARMGESVVLDATCQARWQRDLLRQAAQKAGVAIDFLFLKAPPTLLARRLKAREKGPSVSDARIDLLPRYLASFETPGPDEKDVFSLWGGPLSTMEKKVLGQLLSRLGPGEG